MLSSIRRLKITVTLMGLAVFLLSLVPASASVFREQRPIENIIDRAEPKANIAEVLELQTYHVLLRTKDVRGRIFHHLQEPFAPNVKVQEYVLTVVKGHFYALGNNRVIGISSYQSYYGYRWYDASNGRWINRDPIKEDGGLNVYSFCDGDPINYGDILGHNKRIIAYGLHLTKKAYRLVKTRILVLDESDIIEAMKQVKKCKPGRVDKDGFLMHNGNRIKYDKDDFIDYKKSFDKDGKPIDIKHEFDIPQTGDRRLDFDMADQKAGYTKDNPRPDDYVWHHHQNTRTMQLVPKNAHEGVWHTGGVAVLEKAYKNLFQKNLGVIILPSATMEDFHSYCEANEDFVKEITFRAEYSKYFVEQFTTENVFIEEFNPLPLMATGVAILDDFFTGPNAPKLYDHNLVAPPLKYNYKDVEKRTKKRNNIIEKMQMESIRGAGC